jgi:hypothetical protein
MRIALTAMLAAASLVAAGAADAAAPVTASPPAISGQAYVGRTLSVSNGTWTNSPSRFTYQWLRCDAHGNNCNQLTGETSRTYKVQKADIDNTLLADVTAVNGDGSATANSKPTDVVSDAVAPKTNAQPTVVGTAQVGQSLVAKLGTYTGGRPSSYTFRWQRCDAAGATCSNIPGATGQSYGVVNADVDRKLRVQVNASNPYGTETSLSDVTATVTAVPQVVHVTTSIAASTDAVTCCAKVQLSGSVSTKKAGEPITILAKEFDVDAVTIAGATTSDGSGNWSLMVGPSVQTTYQAKTSTDTSPGVTIGVRPRIGLGYAGGVFTSKVTARDSFAGEVVLLQRQSAAGSWKTLQAIVLDATSRARFKVPLPRGQSTVRAYLLQEQAGAGYLPNESHTRHVSHR